MAKHIYKDYNGRTYATIANADKAARRIKSLNDNQELRYLIAVNDAGRYFPVYVGQEALQAGAHFEYCTVG